MNCVTRLKVPAEGRLEERYRGGRTLAALAAEFKYVHDLLYTEVVLPTRSVDDDSDLFAKALHRVTWSGMYGAPFCCF
jgi:hypothetical protein